MLNHSARSDDDELWSITIGEIKNEKRKKESKRKWLNTGGRKLIRPIKQKRMCSSHCSQCLVCRDGQMIRWSDGRHVVVIVAVVGFVWNAPKHGSIELLTGAHFKHIDTDDEARPLTQTVSQWASRHNANHKAIGASSSSSTVACKTKCWLSAGGNTDHRCCQTIKLCFWLVSNAN